MWDSKTRKRKSVILDFRPVGLSISMSHIDYLITYALITLE